MAPILLALWIANLRVYGARKLWIAARDAGHDIGRDQVARLMRSLGIRGVSKARTRVVTTRPDPTAGRAPDLVDRDFTADRPNQLWVTDIERHEALSNRVVMKGHHCVLVAAGALKLRAA
jgi:putative transposase